MTKSVLVTGGYGFLGRATANRLKRNGYRVQGIGNGRWDREEFRGHGFDEWLDAGVSMSSLMTLGSKFDLIVHCAGNGSVGYSNDNPLQDFQKSVEGTAELLEFIRLENPSALLVYPSSAGVYGQKKDSPIMETDPLAPISTYGYHKRIAEQLCENYVRNYGLRISVVRFFSIYGPGLTKQLLWDACLKLSAVGSEAVFWGTGDETRDWIHVDDAALTIAALAEESEPPVVINGATGDRVTVREVLNLLKESLESNVPVKFNGSVRIGDPRFYHADVTKMRELGIRPTVALRAGIEEYAAWFRNSWSG